MDRTSARPDGRSSASDVKAFVLIAAAVLLIALNLRIPTTALGPLLPEIRADLDSGETFLALLTTIPLALTLVVAPFVPQVTTRFGMNRIIGWALVGIVGGTLIRSIPTTATLLVGTLILGAAIAVGTVLGPAAIASQRTERRGALTGVYTMALSLGPAMALGLTIPMMRLTGFDWRQTLALWSIVGIVALMLWSGYTRSVAPAKPVVLSSGLTASPGENVGLRGTLVDVRVWVLAFYLGVTSLTFYTVSAWLPTTFIMDGMSAAVAGGYTSLINLVSLPFAFVVPVAMRRGWAPVLAPIAPLPAVVGISIYLTLGSTSALWVALLLGLAQGMCLGVSYDQIVQYARSPEHASTVSAITSTVGVAIGSAGPLLYGYGLESTGTYVLPMGGLALLIFIQGISGLWTSRFSR
ncbi:MFS transporter [Yaniella halotolerans]|uniref:MFS transporter n=1 Tax=Yaniella halotolerans TaxID=225453 RepID=UPI0003B73244|nr:MFS transporter [Yaniella halotolerans]